MQKLLLLFFLLPGLGLTAQQDPLRYENYVYADFIGSVKFHQEVLYLSLPIYELGSAGGLVLSFDDLEGDVKDYTYTVVHCDRNWKPTPNLTEMDYIDGFTEARIENYNFSFKTIQSFTHYRLYLPNRDMRFTKSGNYLLKVYEDEEEKKLVITRRFMIVDRKVNIRSNLVIPSMVSKSRTHQEIDFLVDHEQLDIRSPQAEVRAVVLQNGRWDNAITDISPTFTRLNTLIFDFQDKIVFPAGKEYRYFDIRSLRFRADNVAAIEEYYDGFEVMLIKDEKRAGRPYLSFQDLNGEYLIETEDQNNNDLSGNYADVLFSLYSPQPIFERDVYLMGAFTDYQLRDKYRMLYNERVNAYVAKVPLKQGYYDYMFGSVPAGSKNAPLELDDTEGNWYETENQYTILIYYQPFGARYEQLIGRLTISSTR